MKAEEKQFLYVKQKLDYYRLPTIFNYEDIHLLQKLLALLDKQSKHDDRALSPQKIPSSELPQLNDALRHEIGKVIKQNNRLHMDLVVAKQQLLTLKYRNDKLLCERTGGNKENMMLLQIQRERENQLFQEVTQVKYKYNQLMDLVHEDPNIEKKYIKRLMKHRKMEIEERMDQGKDKQMKKGQYQTVTDLEAKMILLQNKLANRETEIARLQKRSEYDGLNMNKILKDFHTNRINNRMNALNEQVQYLQDQNKKMKEQVNYCRKNGGLKQALREQGRKNHQTIKKLQNENKSLKKKMKEKQFDVHQHSKLKNREVEKALEKIGVVQSQSELAKFTIDDLNKKIIFVKGELHHANSQLQKQQKINEEKDIEIDKLKNSFEGDKLLAHYQVQSLKQKVEEYEQKINKVIAENQYRKKEDKLKNEAIENLEEIVDELMRKNSEKGVQSNSNELNSINLQNRMAMIKNLNQTKQQLSSCQNQKEKLEKQMESLIRRFEQKSVENNALIDQVKQFKVRVFQLKNNEEQYQNVQREVSVLQSELKKEQNYRLRIQNLNQQLEGERNKLRKELQEVSYQYEIYQRKTKTHNNDQKLQINLLQESNQLLQIRLKQKDKMIITQQERIQQLNTKINILKNQIILLQEEKHVTIRQKQRYEKRCDQLIKIKQQCDLGYMRYKQNQHNDVLEYQRKLQSLTKNIANKIDENMNLKSLCEALKMSESNLVQENLILRRELEKKGEIGQVERKYLGNGRRGSNE